MLPKLIVLLFVGFVLASPVHGWRVFPNGSSIRSKIAKVANDRVGSTYWSYASSCCNGRNTNKCNYFVYDVGIEAGAQMPTRWNWWAWKWEPVGAGSGGWGDKGASLSSWSQVNSKSLQPGDIVGGINPLGDYHVGIFVGNRMIVSANSTDVEKNSNMFSNNDLVYWRFKGLFNESELSSPKATVLNVVRYFLPTTVHKFLWRGSPFYMVEIRLKIAEVANSKVGSTHWSFASSSGHGANTSKSDYFVYDVGIEAGAKMPTLGWFLGPVGAGSGGWGDKGASLSSWSQVHYLHPGDIVAGKAPGGDAHVGIFVGDRMIVSANSDNIGKNDTMMSYTDLVYWRYQG